MTDDYSDIINLPHPVSKRHPQMSMIGRAAQFSPFAALTGYEDSVKEVARLTENQAILGDDEAAELNKRMAIVREHLTVHPIVTVTYFKQDARKTGGQYLSATGRIKKMDDYEQTILLEDGSLIAIHDILNIEGEVFEED